MLAISTLEPDLLTDVDVLDATRRLVPLDTRHVERGNAEGYLKSGKEMAEVAEEILGASVEFEISITNVDKPLLDFV